MLDKLDSRTIWTNTERTRFFLLVDDQELPPGDFLLRTFTGRKLSADPSALAELEISEEEAKEWLKGEFGKLLDGARGAVDRFTQKLHDAARKADVKNEANKSNNTSRDS